VEGGVMKPCLLCIYLFHSMWKG